MRRIREHFWMCAFLGLALGLVTHHAISGTLTIPFVFSTGNTITASEFNSNFTSIASVINGNIDTSNIATDGVDTDEIAAGAVTTDEIEDGTILEADLATDCVTTTKIQDASITYPKLSAAISGPGRDINFHAYSCVTDTGKVTVTADALTLKDPSTGYWLNVSDVSVVLDPTDGAAALLGHDTAFSHTNERWYHVWVVAKADETVSAVISQSYDEDTVESNVAAIDSDYIYLRHVCSVATDGAAGLQYYGFDQWGDAFRFQSTGGSVHNINGYTSNADVAVDMEGGYHVPAASLVGELLIYVRVGDGTDDGSYSKLYLETIGGNAIIQIFVSNDATDIVYHDAIVPYPIQADGALHIDFDEETGGAGTATVMISGFQFLPMSN